MVKLAASMMCSDLLNLENNIQILDQAGIDFFHIDVMDGNFVPNLGLNLDFITQMRRVTQTPIDVHLMVRKPEDYISRLDKEYCDYLSFHLESTDFPFRLIREVKNRKMRAGIAVNPSTSGDSLKAMIKDIDYTLLMTVEPGFAGQLFIPQMLNKISFVKRIIQDNNLSVLIFADGSINENNGKLCVDHGADVLVCGTSSIFKKDVELSESVIAFREAINSTV